MENSAILPPRTHNNPPLEERIVLDFDEALNEHDGLVARINTMLAKADEVGPCRTEADVGRIGDFIKMVKAAAKVVEDEREILNRPLINARTMLKARADAYTVKLEQAEASVRERMDTYLREKKAEEDRLAAIEAKRLRDIEIAAQAECDRLQKIEDDKAEAERARLQKIEDDRAAAERREAAKVEVKAEPVYVPPPAPAFVSKPAPSGPIRGNYGSSVSVTETWDVKVENIRQVPDVFLKNPAVIEALEKVIRPSVRGKSGMREIKGCRIFSTLGSSVR